MRTRIETPKAGWYKVAASAVETIRANCYATFVLIVFNILGGILSGLNVATTSIYAALGIEAISWLLIAIPLIACGVTFWEWSSIGSFFLASKSGWLVARAIGGFTGFVLLIIEVTPLFGKLFKECADLAGQLESDGRAMMWKGVSASCNNFLAGRYNTIKIFKWAAMLFELTVGLFYQAAIGNFTVTKTIEAGPNAGQTYEAFVPSFDLAWPILYAFALAFAAERTILGCAALVNVLIAAVKEYQRNQNSYQ
jgi:hypothetical protein